MSKRENKAAAAEFRELTGVEFDEFTRRAPVRLLLAVGRYAEPIDVAVLQFADETHPMFAQQREKLERVVRSAWQLRGPGHRRQIVEVVRRYGFSSANERGAEERQGGEQRGEK
jgi:hypothetical protein